MITLQSARNRQDANPPLSDMTNAAPPNTKTTYSLDSLSSQILSLTSIATNLQREMSTLTKRSKDNANDLTGLKDATHARDENIRKTLRELVAGLDLKFSNLEPKLLGAPETARPTSNLGLYLDDKAHDSTPRKQYILPRIPSPNNFASAIDRDITASPSLISMDGAASIALLEKVLREMATREGQDRITKTLESVKLQAQPSGQVVQTQSTIDPQMMEKIEDILNFMRELKEESGSRALVRANTQQNSSGPSQIDLYLEGERSSQLAKKDGADRSVTASGSANVLAMNEELATMLRSVKQSLSQSGGLTNEVKSLVRELRGEVLGMGREMAQKLEKVEQSTEAQRGQKTGPDSEEIAHIVEDSLLELKEHVHHILEENQRHSAELQEKSVDTEQVVTVVQNAIMSMPALAQARDAQAEREEMLAAVKEAWEDCKPEIALEHFGLERDEIIDTLKEGLKSYQPQQPTAGDARASYEDVLEAVRKGFEDFKPPLIQVEPHITREELYTTLRECLQSFDFPTQQQVALPQQERLLDLTRDDVFDAVRDGFQNHAPDQIQAELNHEDLYEAVREGLAQNMESLNYGKITRDELLDAFREAMSQHAETFTNGAFTRDDVLAVIRQGFAENPQTNQLEFNREDLFDAIKACLEGDQNPLGGMGEKVVETMHEFLTSMKTEFQQYSAANGKDTEQVLDALKDGLEELRVDVEKSVNQVTSGPGKEEIIETVKAGFAAMQADMEKGFTTYSGQHALNTPELLDAMEKEFEHLRDSLSKSMTRANPSSDKDEILDAIRDLADDRSSSVSSDNDLARSVKEELEHMRATLAATLVKSGSSLDRDEVLDAIRESFEINRGGTARDGGESFLSNTSELLDAFQEGVDGLRADMQKLADKPADMHDNHEILDGLKASIETLRGEMIQLFEKHGESLNSPSDHDKQIIKHDENTIQNELESLKVMITQLRIKVEALDALPVPQPVAPGETHIHKDDLNEIHTAIREVHTSVNNLDSVHGAVREVHDSVNNLDSLHSAIKDVHQSVNNLDSIHSAIREMHESVNGQVREIPEVVMPANAAAKEDIEAVETLLRNVRAKLDEIIVPDPDSVAKTTHLESVENLLKEIKTVVEETTPKISTLR